MRAILICSLIAMLLAVTSLRAQDVLPLSEPDSDAFIQTNFVLQDTYKNVLCVTDGEACPDGVEVQVPCLTVACDHPVQSYTIERIFSTIQAAAEAAVPGDLILIMPGRYAGVEIEGLGGADGGYIHFLGWGSPGSVVIERRAFPESDWLRHHFYFIDVHHYIVQNLAFEGAQGAGVYFSGFFEETGHFSHHIIMMDIYSHDNGTWGLHTTTTSYILLQDSYFLHNAEHGAYISGSGANVLIRRNVFQDNTSAGLQINADPQSATLNLFYWLENSTGDTCGFSEDDADYDGSALWQDIKRCYDSQNLPDPGEFMEDGISEYLIIEQNVLTRNGEGGGAAINLASVRNGILRNNLIYDNLAAGIACWDNAYAEERGLASSEFGCWDVQITNNTIVDETGGRGALIISRDARKMQVYNNVIVRDRYDAYEVSSNSSEGLQSGSNYYFAQSIDPPLDSNPEERSITGFTIQEALTEFARPSFAAWVIAENGWVSLNPDSPDFHPVAGSILLTGGNPAHSPYLDLYGNPRRRTEIGAVAGQ